MMKLLKRVFLVLLIIMVLCGCKQTGYTRKARNRPDLFFFATYSFFGPNNGLTAQNWDSIAEAQIEKDEYGRELVTVWISPSGFYDLSGVADLYNHFVPTKVKMILQKHDKKKIYYYEDFCFLFETEEGFSSESIEKLKALNDWGAPLTDEKCSSRYYGKKYKDLDFGNWDTSIENVIKKSFPGKAVFIAPVTEDSHGKILCSVLQIFEDSSFKSYYVIYDPSIQDVDPQTGIMELTSLDFGMELHELKIRNDWDFSTCPERQD
jgi:hypothetical protein